MAVKLGDPLKTALRREVLAARDALPTFARGELSARITHKIRDLDAYREASCVLAYMSFGSEFDTSELTRDVLASGRLLCLPRVHRERRDLELHMVANLEQLENGMWGIREPRADSPLADMSRIDFVLLPGVAFTPRCERLGYGGGYYDRLIARFVQRPPLVAAAYELQLRDEIPLAAGDQCADVVITESSLFARR